VSKLLTGNDADIYIDAIYNLFAILKLIFPLQKEEKKKIFMLHQYCHTKH
jgi:hypothetical protein